MEAKDLQRRALLRGLLAVGATLSLPLLSGCGKNAQDATPKSTGGPATDGGIAPVTSNTSGTAPPPATSSTPEAAPPGKLSQAAVKYQDHPMGDHTCATCMQYLPDSNACKLVEGPINPQGWCTIWVQKMT
jgi:hypothetical protein